jgi:predicted DCC family thiol-disulfide oxidoreductase YuxK
VHQQFFAIPYQEAPSPPMTPALREACARSVHVLATDGRVLAGGRAWLFIMEKLGWGWLARLLALPPLFWLVELGYRMVATHRRFFARLGLPWE